MDTQGLIVIGARVRLRELEEEQQLLRQLIASAPTVEFPPAETIVETVEAQEKTHKSTTPAARKKQSQIMKAYWAKRRALKASQS